MAWQNGVFVDFFQFTQQLFGTRVIDDTGTCFLINHFYDGLQILADAASLKQNADGFAFVESDGKFSQSAATATGEDNHVTTADIFNFPAHKPATGVDNGGVTPSGRVVAGHMLI